MMIETMEEKGFKLLWARRPEECRGRLQSSLAPHQPQEYWLSFANLRTLQKWFFACRFWDDHNCVMLTSFLAFPRNSHYIIVLILPEEGVEKGLLGSCPCFSCLVASCLVGFSCLVDCCPWQRPWNPATASHHFCHCGFIEHQSQDQDQARWRRWQPVGKCRQSNCNSRCRQICKVCNWFWSACNGEPNLQLVLISL